MVNKVKTHYKDHWAKDENGFVQSFTLDGKPTLARFGRLWHQMKARTDPDGVPQRGLQRPLEFFSQIDPKKFLEHSPIFPFYGHMAEEYMQQGRMRCLTAARQAHFWCASRGNISLLTLIIS